MNTDEHTETIAFGPDSGPDFVDAIAETLARNMSFDGHGKLTENERNAFVWGFRHGLHQLRGLMQEAAAISPEAAATMAHLVTAALDKWALGVHMRVYTAPAEGAPADAPKT